MKVVGFTIIRNAVKFDFPIVESLTSLSLLCDQVIVAVGKSDDGTLERIKAMNNPKLTIIESVWDDTLRDNGVLFAVETNKAMDAIPADADWIIYSQADEVLHEKEIPVIREAMLKWKDNKQVEGLLLNWKHFYGSYNYLGNSQKWYYKEVRAVRNNRHIRSYKDAQGFRWYNELNPGNEELLHGGRKLNVKQVDAFEYHYGWVKHPSTMQKKLNEQRKIHHADWEADSVIAASDYDYSTIDSLERFTGEHPLAMKERIEKQNWDFEFDVTKKKYTLKGRVIQLCIKLFGWRPGEYRNYKLI